MLSPIIWIYHFQHPEHRAFFLLAATTTTTTTTRLETTHYSCCNNYFDARHQRNGMQHAGFFASSCFLKKFCPGGNPSSTYFWRVTLNLGHHFKFSKKICWTTRSYSTTVVRRNILEYSHFSLDFFYRRDIENTKRHFGFRFSSLYLCIPPRTVGPTAKFDGPSLMRASSDCYGKNKSHKHDRQW